MKTLLRFIACTLLLATTAFAQQAFVSGSIPPYASGSVSELNGSQIISNASINQNGYFSTAISSTPTHTFRINPVAGSAYAPFSVTVTVSTSGTTDISSTLLANIPSPTPTPFPSISVLTPYVTIDSITYKWPATQGSGCLSNDGSGNFSWIACSSSSGTVTSVSALAPLFTTTTPTTAATFVLSTQAANSVFGNFTGSAAAPTFSAAPVFSAANLTNLPLASPSPIGNTTPNSGAFTTVTATGNVNVQGTINSTLNTSPAGITNSGVALSAAPDVADVVYYDSTRTTDNHIAEAIWFQGAYQLRFKSDSQSLARAFFTATGGYAAGSAVLALNGNTTVTGNLNTTGNANSATLSATGNISTPANIIARGPATTTPVNVATESSVQLFTPAANQSAVAYINSTNTTDNRIAYSAWGGTSYTVAGFANDVWNNGKQGVTMTGGYAAGVLSVNLTAGAGAVSVTPTGIASNSGSGSWAHTGGFSAASLTASGIASGNCVQTGVGGLLGAASGPCYVANSSTGTVAVAAGAGVGGTASCTGTCTAARGRVSVVSAGVPAAGDDATVTFGTAYATAPVCQVTINGGTTAFNPGWNSTTTVLTINTGLAISGTVEFDYFCQL